MPSPDPTALSVAGVAAVPLIVALIEGAKQAGLPPRWAAGAAIALGLLVSLGYQAVDGPVDARAWLDAVVVGLALGLSAAGLYSGARAAARSAPEP